MKPSKEPKKVVWMDDFDGGKYPACPSCNELAYYSDKCCFCGQVFDQEDDALQEFHHSMQIEKDGYTIIQTHNNHVHIYGPDGEFVSHGTCSSKMTEKELLLHLEFVLNAFPKKVKRNG